MNNFLYHRVPKDFAGNILYPLNQLQEKYPSLYEEQISKYKGREFVKNQHIPVLDCLWNDVIHLGAVNPSEIYEELKKYDDTEYTSRFYKIPPEILEEKNTIVYLYKHKENEQKMSPDNFTRFVPNKIYKYSKFPQETKDYYEEAYKTGKPPLLWHRVPHILYKGTIDTDDLEIIEV